MLTRGRFKPEREGDTVLEQPRRFPSQTLAPWPSEQRHRTCVFILTFGPGRGGNGDDEVVVPTAADLAEHLIDVDTFDGTWTVTGPSGGFTADSSVTVPCSP